jgi:hypothetical protein
VSHSANTSEIEQARAKSKRMQPILLRASQDASLPEAKRKKAASLHRTLVLADHSMDRVTRWREEVERIKADATTRTFYSKTECLECGVTTSSMVGTSIYRYRLAFGLSLPMNRELGWCYSCESFTNAEELLRPSEQSNSDKPLSWGERLKWWYFFRKRQSPPRCLTCGEYEIKTYEDEATFNETPQRHHSGCKGYLVSRPTGIHFYTSRRRQLANRHDYDMEGKAIITD